MVKSRYVIGMIFLLVVSIFLFSGCNFGSTPKTITSIEVDPTTLEESYDVDTFDISTIKIKVNYSDGTSNLVSVKKTMLSSEHFSLLSTSGEHSIPITFEGKTTTVVIKIEYSEVRKQLMAIYTLATTEGGFTGTYEEWLAGIQGEAGEDGHSPVITIGTNGNWYIDGVDTLVQAQGLQGEVGNGISAIALTKTEGLVDTYTITYTDGTTSTFTLTNGADGLQGIQGEAGEDGHSPVITIGTNGNWYIDGVDTLVQAQGLQGEVGNGISAIALTKTEGLVDTYTITYTDGTTSTFTLTNGADGLQGIQGEAGEDGHSPVITIGTNGNWYIDGVDTLVQAQGLQGEVGNGISAIALTKTEGLVDTYTITYTDGTTSTFTLTNGADGKSAYEIYKENNLTYTKTEIEWLEDLINGNLVTVEAVKYTISFNSNGGSIIEEQQVIENKKIMEPANPTKDGYIFAGWYYGNERWSFIGYVVTENMTLTAKWNETDTYGITFDSQEFTYDGSAKTISITGNLPTGISVVYINNGKIDAGVHEVTARFIDTTIQNRIIPDLVATITIHKATISGIGFSGATYDYQKGTSRALQITGILPSDVSVSYTNNNKENAGTYEVTATFIYSSNNYHPISDMNATLVINKLTIDMSSVALNSSTYLYDGQTKSLIITGLLPEGVSVTYINNDKINVGSYEVVANFTFIDEINYNLISDITATMTIMEADISGISISDATYIYDGLEKSLTITGTLPTGVSVSYTNNKKTNAGTYEVIATFTDSTGNYNKLPDMKANLVIEKKSLPSITFTNATYVYDGLVKSLSIVGTLPEGVSVSYENNNQINAGSYQVSAILADINNNYLLPTNLIATLTIQKATFDMSEITFEDQLYIDDNQEKTLLITGTLPSGVTVTYSNNKLTAPGELLVTATFIYDSQNYNQINPLTAKLTIIEVGARLDSPSIAFDGEWLDWGNKKKL